MKKAFLILSFLFTNLSMTAAQADTIINNYSTTPDNSQKSQAASAPCPPANQNNIYDPRVPPAGVYRHKNSTTYTTGEKKPYITDNNCKTENTRQPYVIVRPRS